MVYRGTLQKFWSCQHFFPPPPPTPAWAGTGMFTSTNWATSSLVMQIYKITKIVCVLWLAERSVCMTVCKHGLVVASSCIGFCALITRNEFEKVFEFKTRQVYFIYIFLRRQKLGKSLQTSCVNFFWLSCRHFKREKSHFGKHLFAKRKLIARLRVQDFMTSKNSYFNQGTIKRAHLSS